MDIFDVFTLIGGLALFLFGMSVMGSALEKRAGGGLKNLLGRLTTSKAGGIATGAAVTVVTQASSATTVMVVGFVNSRLMTLSQAINVIIGANVGTTVTAWILSLNGISSDNIFLRLLKPTSFTPVLAFIGIILYMFSKKGKNKEIGTVLLGFATLMTGMAAMTSSVGGLTEIPQFTNLLVIFSNPFLGVLMGLGVTALIQSSAASIGILQALAATGQVTWGTAIPIVMGQNIGTCVTAVISSFGATKNGKRAALSHLLFNVFGTVIYLTAFCLVKWLLAPVFLNKPISLYGIAASHTVFNILTMLVATPLTSALEKIVTKLIPDSTDPDDQDDKIELDERLFSTPPFAVERCRLLTLKMAERSGKALETAIDSLWNLDTEKAARVRKLEERTDVYEDEISTYLVKLSGREIGEKDSAEAAFLLKVVGDYERIGDHALNILESAEEIADKKIVFGDDARKELEVLLNAVTEIFGLTYNALSGKSATDALEVEPLEQVIDDLKESIRKSHIRRLQKGECTVDAGFVLSDLLTNLERVSDHCSNVAGAIIDLQNNDMMFHEAMRHIKTDSATFKEMYNRYSEKYAV